MSVWANIIRDLMQEQRVSERRLADASGVCRSTVRSMLKGNGCSIDKFEALLVALGYKLDLIPIEGFEPAQPDATPKKPIKRNRDKFRGIKPLPEWLGEQVEDA